MKLCFVENRTQTMVWQAVAKRLQRDRHEIHWIILNPIYTPRFGCCHHLPLSPPRESHCLTSDDITLLQSDRAVRYFGLNGNHYASFRIAIKKILDEVQPDFIFGEATQFYEQITLREAQRRNILYLVPGSTRYPPGRTIFHLYDSLETVGGEGIELSFEEALALRENILQGHVVLSYMRTNDASILKRNKSWVIDHFKTFIGWIIGERFITPSPWRKYHLEHQQRKLLARYDKNSQEKLPDSIGDTPWVLYAMQMQPESNIDVWGYPWNDQTAIIREAADALFAAGFKLVVKPNPKSKYEIDTLLCELIESHPGIISLKHSTKMHDVFPYAPVILSVTGTIQIEAILAGKPVGVLGSHAMSCYPGVTSLSRPHDIVRLVQDMVKGQATVATLSDATQLLSLFHRSSYGASIDNSLGQSAFSTSENLDKLTAAFSNIINMRDVRDCEIYGL